MRSRRRANVAGSRAGLSRYASGAAAAAVLLSLPGAASAQQTSHPPSSLPAASTSSGADIDPSADAQGGGNDAGSAPPPSPFSLGASQDDKRSWFATVYAGRKAEGNLWDMAGDAVTGGLQFDRQYFVGASVSYVLLRDIRVPIPFTDKVAGPSIEVEGQLDRHFGDGVADLGADIKGSPNSLEAIIAAVIRTRDLPIFAGITVNFALGDGPSFSFTDPRWEYGHRRLNNYMSIEAELTSQAVPWLHLIPQIHHRSGAYGLIAPTSDGSNFLGFGLRVDLN